MVADLRFVSASLSNFQPFGRAGFSSAAAVAIAIPLTSPERAETNGDSTDAKPRNKFLPELVSGRGTATRSGVVEGECYDAPPSAPAGLPPPRDKLGEDLPKRTGSLQRQN